MSESLSTIAANWIAKLGLPASLFKQATRLASEACAQANRGSRSASDKLDTNNVCAVAFDSSCHPSDRIWVDTVHGLPVSMRVAVCAILHAQMQIQWKEGRPAPFRAVPAERLRSLRDHYRTPRVGYVKELVFPEKLS